MWIDQHIKTLRKCFISTSFICVKIFQDILPNAVTEGHMTLKDDIMVGEFECDTLSQLQPQPPNQGAL